MSQTTARAPEGATLATRDKPYIVVPYGRHDESGTVYKVGPRGGRYFIVQYQHIATAETVADWLNTFRDMER